MSTGGISARNLHLRRAGGDTIGSVSMSANVPICVLPCIQITINNIQPFKEGDKEMYTRVLFFGDFLILHSDIIWYSVYKRYGVGPQGTAKTF